MFDKSRPLSGEFLVAAFRDLYSAQALFVPPQASAQRVSSLNVGGHVLLDAWQLLADYRRNLRQQSADSNVTLPVDALILQLDEYHRASTCDALAFRGAAATGKTARTTFKAKAIVTAVQSCTLLRDSGDLERQMRCAVRLLLPDQAEDLTRAMGRGLVRAPSPASVSRWRLAVDVGFMFVMRSLVAQNRSHAVRCLLADSSPQRGFDWFLTEWHTLAPANFDSWMSNVWQLIHNRCRAQQLSQALESTCHDQADLESQLYDLQQERKTLETLPQGTASHGSQPTVDVHLSFPTAQGSKRASIVHKIHALLHTLYLEVGGWHQVAGFLASVRSVTTDFGAESGLADMGSIDVSALFPWTSAAEAPNFDNPQADMSDFLQPDPNPNPEAAPENTFIETRVMDNGETHLFLPKLFPLALQVPGGLHILHHTVEEITSCLEGYESWFFPGLKAVTAVMGKKYVRERFVAEILRFSESHDLEQSVLQLQLNLHEARWGTLVNTCKKLESVRLVFSLWDADKVMGQAPGPEASDADREAYGQVQAMTAAVQDVSWWAYLQMVLRLARAVDLIEHWLEACPCHYRKFNDNVLLSGNAVFRTRYSCPRWQADVVRSSQLVLWTSFSQMFSTPSSCS